MRARCNCVFDVPTEIPSSAAISGCVWPSTSYRTNTWREPGGSVEHWNAEAGAVWMARLLKRFRNAIWINPRDPRAWEGTSSARLMRQLMEGRMYPLTLDGLEAGLKELQRGR